MEKSIIGKNEILDLSAPGQVAPELLSKLAQYGNLLEYALQDTKESSQRIKLDYLNISEEYLTKDDDDRFTAILENKLNKNYPSNY